jgi:putative addiction module antidote
MAMVEIRVRKVGNSLGVILPSEVAKALGVGEGDTLYLTESQDGLRLTPHDPDFERQMRLAEDGMREFRNALRDLSKR